jgi:large subunit ribosomal protein L1
MAEAKKTPVKKSKKADIETIKDVDVTKAAIDSAEQAETVKAEKRTTKPVAKAGKRSVKGVEEAEQKEAKIERQKHAAEAASESAKQESKQPVKPPRSRLERRGKKFREVAKNVDASKLYTSKEALTLAIKTSTTKFDSTVELHIRLGVDPRQADQNLRDNLVLPAGTGKTVRVAVFAEEDIAKEALKAGADVAGYEDFLKQLDKGTIDFDILIATPNVMAKLSKYARILGPKGLMPNPKSGTVTNDVNKAISQSKAGRVEYRVDSTGIVHLGIGKVSFGSDKLAQNLDAVFASIKQNKPASLKGIYVRSISVSTTMGPGIKIQPSELS